VRPSTRRATPCEKGAASFGQRLGGEHDRRLPAEGCQDDVATGLEGFQLGRRQLPGAGLCGALDAYGQRVARPSRSSFQPRGAVSTVVVPLMRAAIIR